jgi:tRNA (guanine-N7-)-methyltransferase
LNAPTSGSPPRARADTRPQVNLGRIEWDLARLSTQQFEKYWKERENTPIPPELFLQQPSVWLEIGAGSGWFAVDLARRNPSAFVVAIERSRMRGKRLVRKAVRSCLPNLAAFRGNAIPALIHAVPSESVERVYLLYPCPWPKTAQRKNRWYLHPIMSHLVRILKADGLLIWASDQKFFIDEAEFVCARKYGMETLVLGELSPNPYNDLEHSPEGRSKFERSFLERGQPCYELIVRKVFPKKSTI